MNRVCLRLDAQVPPVAIVVVVAVEVASLEALIASSSGRVGQCRDQLLDRGVVEVQRRLRKENTTTTTRQNKKQMQANRLFPRSQS